MAAAQNTIEDAMIACGVPDTPEFGGQSPPQRMAEQLFVNSFETVLSISIEDVKDAMTAFKKTCRKQWKDYPSTWS